VSNNGRRSYVIVGNGNAGTNAAEALRKSDQDARIVLIGNEPYPLYNRVSLPPYLKKKVPQAKVIMRTVEQHAQKNIELHLSTRASVDIAQREVHCDTGQTFAYDALLLAVGGTPNPLRVPGADVPGVCCFQTLDDTDDILGHAASAKNAVVFGGSYIAYELAEGLATHGIPVAWVMRGPRFLRQILDDAGGRLVEGLAAAQGVKMIFGDEPAGVLSEGGRVTAACTRGGQRLAADIVASGLGLNLNTGVCEGTSIRVNRGIVTDEYLETNVPGVFSAGDCAEFYDAERDTYCTLGTWDSAGLQGRLVARNMAVPREERQPFTHGSLYTSTLFASRITVFGTTPADDPTLEAVVECDAAACWYKRLFFRDRLLVGGALIGDAARARAPLMHLIRRRQEIEPAGRSRLLDGDAAANLANELEPAQAV